MARELTMTGGTRNAVSVRGGVKGLENAKVDAAAIHLDGSAPFARMFMPRNAFLSACVVLLRSAIASIFPARAFPQVLPFVIGWVKVAVVALAGGPCSRHVQPRQPVQKIFSAINGREKILLLVSALHPNRTVHFGSWIEPNTPSEHARLRVVIQHFAQAFGRDKVFGGHWRGSIAAVSRGVVAVASGPTPRLPYYICSRGAI